MQLNWQILHIAQCLLCGPCTNYNIWITNPRLNHLASPASYINLVSLIHVISSAEVRYLCPDSWNVLHYPWMTVTKRVNSSLSLCIWNHTVMNIQSYISRLFYTKELLSMNTKAESKTQRSKASHWKGITPSELLSSLSYTQDLEQGSRETPSTSPYFFPVQREPGLSHDAPGCIQRQTFVKKKKNSVMIHLCTNSPEKKKSLELFYFHIK